VLSKIEAVLQKYENWILIILLIVFILVNMQGLDWGLPARWNPDEIMGTVNLVLHGQATINETNFDYPGLPMYFMLFWGYGTQFLGKSNYAFGMIARFFSVVLGGMTVWAGYAAMKQISSKKWPALLAALLVATSNELAANVHFAHNDPYVTFFSALVIYLSLKYLSVPEKKWLYLAFFAAGLTISSKFNGGGILISPFLAYILVQKKDLLTHKLEALKTYSISAVLAILGFGVGTPKFLTSFLVYMNGVLPALWRHANSNKSELSQPGILTQWGMMIQVFGLVFFILGMIAIAAILVWLIRKRISNDEKSLFSADKVIVLLVSLFILDLPILVSYNVQSRFFLPLLVPLSMCLALFAALVVNRLEETNHGKLVWAVIALGLGLVIFSAMRVGSTVVNIVHDARYEAADYIATLPYESYVETTNYGPNISEKQLEGGREYPLLILKFDGQTLPESLQGIYNTGEPGIELRQPDYLVVSSLVSEKFTDPGLCERHQADCDFFGRLFAGETHYQLIKTFKVEDPWYLPKVVNVFINPDIYLFERIEP
jgi:hypothetical protein